MIMVLIVMMTMIMIMVVMTDDRPIDHYGDECYAKTTIPSILYVFCCFCCQRQYNSGRSYTPKFGVDLKKKSGKFL